MRHPPTISIAVEGIVDTSACGRILSDLGLFPGSSYGKTGKIELLKRIHGYNRAANRDYWLVLVDLDHDENCAPLFIKRVLPKPASKMIFRVVVRELETWLMADRARFSSFLGIPISQIPIDPETIDDPKEFVVSLARNSRKTAIIEDMIPRPGSERKVGGAYSSRLIEFIHSRIYGWRPSEAEKNSDSLNRCLEALRRLI